MDCFKMRDQSPAQDKVIRLMSGYSSAVAHWKEAQQRSQSVSFTMTPEGHISVGYGTRQYSITQCCKNKLEKTDKHESAISWQGERGALTKAGCTVEQLVWSLCCIWIDHCFFVLFILFIFYLDGFLRSIKNSNVIFFCLIYLWIFFFR